jgi:hypothetical protein
MPSRCAPTVIPPARTHWHGTHAHRTYTLTLGCGHRSLTAIANSLFYLEELYLYIEVLEGALVAAGTQPAVAGPLAS